MCVWGGVMSQIGGKELGWTFRSHLAILDVNYTLSMTIARSWFIGNNKSQVMNLVNLYVA